jgi:hypothetical protein
MLDVMEIANKTWSKKESDIYVTEREWMSA